MKYVIPTHSPRRPLSEEITSWNSFRKRHLKRPTHTVPTPELEVEDALVKTPTVTGVANDRLSA